jgi:hypothetical protein
MLKIVVFGIAIFASAPALAQDWKTIFREQTEEMDRMRDTSALDAQLRADREYDQRERLANDQIETLEAIQRQMVIQNLNTMPRR